MRVSAKVSVIIPCYNCAETLEDAVSSVYQSNVSFPFEVVLVDDASTDSTREMISRLAARYPHLKYFVHDKNQGGGATRNKAVSLSEGELIFCLDSDDMLLPDTLDRLVRYQQEKSCDGVGVSTSVKFRGQNAHDVAFTNHFGYVGQQIPFECLLEKNGVYCSLYSTFLITREAFDKIGGYPTEHGFDTQGIAWRFLAAGLTAYTCPNTTYLHRIEFHESYYLREAQAGKENYNWQDIFFEHFCLFDAATQEFILTFNCKNFSRNILDELKKRKIVFREDYQKNLGLPCENIPARTHREYVRRNSLRGITYRIIAKTRRLLTTRRFFTRTATTLQKARYYAWIIKTRSGNGVGLFFFWMLLRFRKFLRRGFRDSTENHLQTIDVVIPTISKDFELLSTVIESVRRHVRNPVQHIYIVSKQQQEILDFCAQHDCRFIDELSVLGYGKDAISYRVNGVDRSGWMFQQLLKLSAGSFTECENYLVLDSDTILIHDHVFIENEKFVFLQSEEWHAPYFRAFEKMFGYKAKTKLSYTSHMMIFNKEKLREMKAELEKKHDKPWDQVYLSTIDEHEASCVSDYDTYANWMLCNYPELMLSRPLYNRPLPRTGPIHLPSLENTYAHTLKSLSFHSYITTHP